MCLVGDFDGGVGNGRRMYTGCLGPRGGGLGVTVEKDFWRCVRVAAWAYRTPSSGVGTHTPTRGISGETGEFVRGLAASWREGERLGMSWMPEEAEWEERSEDGQSTSGTLWDPVLTGGVGRRSLAGWRDFPAS